MRLALASVLVLALAACGGPNRTPFGAPAPTGTATCLPNLDGTITAAELRPVIGATLTYDVSTDVPVDLAGRQDGGRTLWDWSATSGGTKVTEGPVALAGQWYAGAFPTGTFVLPAGGGLVGVYRADDTAVWLLGTASADPSPRAGRTRLVYDAPVAVYRFPITAGATWTCTAAVTGTFDGLPYRGQVTYAASVGDAGELRLPDVTFTEVLPVNFTVTNAPDPGDPGGADGR